MQQQQHMRGRHGRRASPTVTSTWSMELCSSSNSASANGQPVSAGRGPVTFYAAVRMRWHGVWYHSRFYDSTTQ